MQYLFNVRLAILVLFSFVWMSVSAQKDTSKSTYPPNALYIIDLKESTKEEVEKLDSKVVKSVNVWKGETATMKYGDKGKNGVVVVNTMRTYEPAIDNSDSIFTKVEVAAAFPGGVNGWRKYLENNLNYPRAAQKKNTQGAVRVQMVVRKDGSVTNVQVLSEPGDDLGKEGKRVVEQGPKWIPATQNGKPVNYQFVQTITFQIQ